MRKLIFLFILMLTVGVATKAADVTFKASAPQAVVMGEQFRLTFTVNAEGRDLRVQEMPDFDVLMGPSQSTSYSSSWVNGKSTSETTVTYTYVLMPKKEGTFNIAPATIKRVRARRFLGDFQGLFLGKFLDYGIEIPGVRGFLGTRG